MIVDDRFLNSHDMARIYCVPSANAFIQRFRRDQKKPVSLRMYPDPVNPDTGRGHIFLWRPADVKARLEPTPTKKARG